MPTHDFIDVGDVLNFDIIRGTIVTIDSVTDTCTVTVGGDALTALLCYHCDPDSVARDSGAIEGAADGFEVGDEVIVLKRKDNGVVKVIGHTDGIRRCTEPITGNDYYIFYLDGSTLKIANCTYGDEGLEVIDTRDYTEVLTNNTSYPVTFHCKRFSHNVPTNGETITRDLYFIATSLYINPNPYTGWVNFAAANPTFELVTNNTNTRITMTEQVRTDMNEVNELVNTSHTYSGDSGGDNWRIMEAGETGDCEDFALTKAKALLDLGYPASAIHIEAAMIDGSLVPNIGHAWLVVQTTTGDYALDTSSNSIVRNSSLRSNIGTEYICRRRQIGSNWAFISPFGWMMSSINDANYTYHYILDPLLNIFYYMDNHYNDYGSSINFSGDNGGIYTSLDPGTYYIINKYALIENKLDLIIPGTQINKSNSQDKILIDREGEIVPGGECLGNSSGTYPDYYIPQTSDKASKDGYYGFENILVHITGHNEYINHGDGTGTRYQQWNRSAPTTPETVWSQDYSFIEYTWGGLIEVLADYYHVTDVIYYDCVCGKNLHNPLYIVETREGSVWDFVTTITIHTPFGEIIDNSTGSRFRPLPLTQIDTDELLIQGFRLDRYISAGDNLKRLYKDGVSILSEVLSAVGTTEANLLGFVYVPSTDRL